ncbi:MAG: hypothetical protein ABIR69_07930 [Nitrospiraceae bacterium]
MESGDHDEFHHDVPEGMKAPVSVSAGCDDFGSRRVSNTEELTKEVWYGFDGNWPRFRARIVDFEIYLKIDGYALANPDWDPEEQG